MTTDKERAPGITEVLEEAEQNAYEYRKLIKWRDAYESFRLIRTGIIRSIELANKVMFFNNGPKLNELLRKVGRIE